MEPATTPKREIPIRLPETIWRELDDLAKRNHRSRNAEVTYALERHVTIARAADGREEA